MQNLINTENGELHFGNQYYISAKTTLEDIREMEETFDQFFENLEMGIQNLAFFNKEIEGNFYQISVHFNFGKLSTVVIQFKNGKQILELSVWKEMKLLKQFSNPKKTQMKSKNYHWGSVFGSYTVNLNFGNMNLSYKN
ncbi:hypothetical protein N6B72_13740 [Chryseobacterium soli]|uniref:hypothetical protein n=1 Tax=Chryseobacterium soli TaxID=445961 RepID=UPI0029542E38|nr:hypothetical protein [Chryseobacterium soli]MDV7697983.1 hypothetical protein [Chryseobacterium soli]